MRFVCLLTCFLYVLVLKVDVVGSDYYPLEIISGDLDENSQIEYVETIVVESVNKKYTVLHQQLINLGFTETSDSKSHQSIKELTRVSDLGEESFRLYLNNKRTDKSTRLKLQYHVTLKDLEKKEIVSYYKRLNSFIATIYTDDRNIYSCGSVIFHDMIESNEFLTKIIKTLDVKTMDQQTDQDLHMMTGYTKQLTQYYLENTKKKNLQLASRVRSDGSVYVSIGTPILTIEY
ncbi:TATA-box binding [Halolactibacillus miurensis]|uniref:TATA-box binding n=1 Tax=Halolactibacillus miurensis TaxID=306541 RepID=A0A1I6UIT3_9BACI|nr:TATA-box binding [Halolactibacillus miurensis]